MNDIIVNIIIINEWLQRDVLFRGTARSRIIIACKCLRHRGGSWGFPNFQRVVLSLAVSSGRVVRCRNE
jgi:hypothetical protein